MNLPYCTNQRYLGYIRKTNRAPIEKPRSFRVYSTIHHDPMMYIMMYSNIPEILPECSSVPSDLTERLIVAFCLWKIFHKDVSSVVEILPQRLIVAWETCYMSPWELIPTPAGMSLTERRVHDSCTHITHTDTGEPFCFRKCYRKQVRETPETRREFIYHWDR